MNRDHLSPDPDTTTNVFVCGIQDKKRDALFKRVLSLYSRKIPSFNQLQTTLSLFGKIWQRVALEEYTTYHGEMKSVVRFVINAECFSGQNLKKKKKDTRSILLNILCLAHNGFIMGHCVPQTMWYGSRIWMKALWVISVIDEWTLNGGTNGTHFGFQLMVRDRLNAAKELTHIYEKMLINSIIPL